jgi:cyclic-di-AMP phosphodiesterase PgpH
MATGGQKRSRWERVAALELPPGQWERAWSRLRHRDMLARIALAFLAAGVMAVVIRAWEPPFWYRTGYAPARSIVARAPFTLIDPVATEQRARAQVRYVYSQDPAPLVELRALLRNSIIELTSAGSLQEVPPPMRAEFGLAVVSEGAPPGASPDPSAAGERAGAAGESSSEGEGEAANPSAEPPRPTPAVKSPEEAAFEEFRAAFTGPENLERLDQALEAVFGPLEQRGVLQRLPQEPGRGSQEEILVHLKGRDEPPKAIKVADVLIGDGTVLRETLRAYFTPPEVADRLFGWLLPRLHQIETLTLDAKRTDRAIAEALRRAEPELIHYQAGQTLVDVDRPPAARPLGPEQIRLLELEHAAWLAALPASYTITRATAAAGMIFALFLLCGAYMRFRQRGPLASVTRLTVLLLLGIVTVALARAASADPWRGELVPLMLFGMTIAIVYRQELALLLSGVLAFIMVAAIGQGLPGFLLLMGVTTVGNLSMGRIRSRAKLIYVGLAAGAVAAVLYVALALLDNQPLGPRMLRDGVWHGLWAVAAGFLMTGLLPFVERLFGVLTDLSLLELGDVSHPLLQELVRRAPSTYNHSVTVGTIAEAAAESIGARGLLVRVGAYFHDIGKMLKPGYFIENQGQEASRHDTLVPAMSTLVIIAHIKDGSDLARQHRLPQPIIDLIAQHHGTTLVEYFYGRAQERKRSDPNGTEVDEGSYRYPGPKPQTKEAAVLMLADAVESASRTLVDPTPARIENVVRDVAEKRLRDGQFDESGLTLRELRTIERSMVVSLISIYHGRIKYPETQKTA